MAHAPLATEADLLARWEGLQGSLAVALRVASGMVREAADAVISSTTSTLTCNPRHETFLPLPGPVTAVTSATIAGAPAAGYVIEPDGLRYDRGWGSGAVSVTFT